MNSRRARLHLQFREPVDAVSERRRHASRLGRVTVPDQAVSDRTGRLRLQRDSVATAAPAIGSAASSRRWSASARSSASFFPSGRCRAISIFKGYKEFAAENRADGWNTWVTFVDLAGRADPVSTAAHGHEIARTLAGGRVRTSRGRPHSVLVFDRTSTSLATSFSTKNSTSATIAFLPAIKLPSSASLITSGPGASRMAGIASRASLSLVARTRTAARSSTANTYSLCLISHHSHPH